MLTRFWKKVERRSDSECWRWTGSYLPSGYGAFWMGRNNVTAHRAAYLLLVGEVPPGLVVRHSCDHKWCVNPAHLGTGTQAQNISDKVHRDRQAKGSRHGMSRLTEGEVAAMKTALALGHHQVSIAFCGGVDRQFVWRLARGISWKHVKPLPHQ